MAVSKIKALASDYKTSGLIYVRCTYKEGGYAEAGNLVIVNIRYKTTGQQAIIGGFPKSKLQLVGAVAYDFISDEPVCAYLSQSGNGSELTIPSKYGGTARELLVSLVYEKA